MNKQINKPLATKAMCNVEGKYKSERKFESMKRQSAQLTTIQPTIQRACSIRNHGYAHFNIEEGGGDRDVGSGGG